MLKNANKMAKEDIAKRANMKRANILWEDISSEYGDTGYSKAKGGMVLRTKFTSIDDSEILGIKLNKGPNSITIESRYGYVAAWLNDEEQIIPELRFAGMHDKYELSETEEAVRRAREKIDEQLNLLREEGIII